MPHLVYELLHPADRDGRQGGDLRVVKPTLPIRPLQYHPLLQGQEPYRFEESDTREGSSHLATGGLAAVDEAELAGLAGLGVDVAALLSAALRRVLRLSLASDGLSLRTEKAMGTLEDEDSVVGEAKTLLRDSSEPSADLELWKFRVLFPSALQLSPWKDEKGVQT